MCIIIREDLRERVEVSGTRLFGRLLEDGSQVLVYSMVVENDGGAPTAMILPVPVAKGSEDALAWINLKDYPGFFKCLDRLSWGQETWSSLAVATFGGSERPTLRVHEVGDYIASFVPGIEHFPFLSERFRLPEVVLDQKSTRSP